MKELYKKPLADIYLLMTKDMMTASDEDEENKDPDPSVPDLDW